MSDIVNTTDDPRDYPGDMTGGDNPHEFGSVVLDTRRAVILDSVDVSTVDDALEDGGSLIALLLSGRVNQSRDRAKLLFIFGSDGAAAIITQLIALLGRFSQEDSDELMQDILRRWKDLKDAGHTS